MAFNGTLLSVGGDAFPMQYIEAKTYKVTTNQRQDLDPYRNANGELFRNVVAHTASIIEMKTRTMTNTDIETLMSFLRSRYIDEAERRVILSYFCPDINDYKQGEFYLPNSVFEFTIHHIKGTTIYYEPQTIKFIEY